MDPIFIVFMLFVSSVIAIYYIVKPIVTEQKKRRNAVNTDSEMKKFYYLLENNSATAIGKLGVKNINDSPEYSFNKDSSVIKFELADSSIEYKLSFVEVQTYNYMIAKCEKPIEDRSLPYTINLFFARKINATPVESDYFEALLKNNGVEIA